jgi:hypothetical protein
MIMKLLTALLQNCSTYRIKRDFVIFGATITIRGCLKFNRYLQNILQSTYLCETAFKQPQIIQPNKKFIRVKSRLSISTYLEIVKVILHTL